MKQRFSLLSVLAIAILLAMPVLFLHTTVYAEDANVNTPNLIAPSPDSNTNAVANVNEDLNVNADDAADVNAVLDDTNVNAEDALTATATSTDDEDTSTSNMTLIIVLIAVILLILIAVFGMRRKKPQQPQ